jgi:S1-C subfamily serine protease
MTGSKIRKSIKWRCVTPAFVFLSLMFLTAPELRSAEASPQVESTKGVGAVRLSQDYSKEITRKGKVVVVSRMLANKIKADSSIVTAALTVKASLDKRGKGNGYRIVAVDKGSLAQKLGILKNDIIQEVNGLKLVSSDDIKQAEERFKDSADFRVKIIRKGRVGNLYYEIR